MAPYRVYRVSRIEPFAISRGGSGALSVGSDTILAIPSHVSITPTRFPRFPGQNMIFRGLGPLCSRYFSG